MSSKSLLAALAILTAPFAAQAGFVTIDIVPHSNAQVGVGGILDGLVSGSTYPTGAQTYAGVPIDLGPNGEIWNGRVAAAGGSIPVSVTIPINLTGVTTVYTAINSLWGSPNEFIASITFTAPNGFEQTFALIGDFNIRDHNPTTTWTDSLDPTSNAINLWTNQTGQRMDGQRWDLDPAFQSLGLESITLDDRGADSSQRLVLFAVTAEVSDIPAPAGVALALAGLGLMAARRDV